MSELDSLLNFSHEISSISSWLFSRCWGSTTSCRLGLSWLRRRRKSTRGRGWRRRRRWWRWRSYPTTTWFRLCLLLWRQRRHLIFKCIRLLFNLKFTSSLNLATAMKISLAVSLFCRSFLVTPARLNISNSSGGRFSISISPVAALNFIELSCLKPSGPPI